MKRRRIYPGNDCSDEAYRNCSQCKGDFCDVCHKHDAPRGDCDECPGYRKTEKENNRPVKENA